MDESPSANNVNSFKMALSKLTGDSSGLPDKIKEFMMNNKASFSDWVAGEIAYSGFDAIVMRKKVLSKIKSQEDMFIIIAIALVRGNNVTNILKSIKGADCKKILLNAKSSLKLVDRVGGDVSAVTLSRILACFPDITPYVLNDTNLSMVVPLETLQQIYKFFPECARHQTTAGIIPEETGYETMVQILDVYMVPYMLTSKIINTKNKEWAKLNLKTQFETNARYLMNSVQSKVLTNTRKKQLSEDIGMLKDEVLTGSWSTAAVACKRWLIEQYTTSMGEFIEAY